MKENPDIDDVLKSTIEGGMTVEDALNGFIDDELTERQKTEVHRLMAHDRRIAQRLRELQNCRLLVSSLPYIEAPSDMLENIKASLETRSLRVDDSGHFSRQKGARDLLVRRVLSATAMIVLVAALGVVIYGIVSPERLPTKTVVLEEMPAPAVRVEPEKPAPPVVVADKKFLPAPVVQQAEFDVRLELKTNNLAAVDAFIGRAIEDKGLSEYLAPKNHTDESVHIVSCDKETFRLLAADLEGIWERFDSATLFAENRSGRVVVNAVNARQVAEIAGQDTFEESIAAAKDFAALNNMTETLPGREVLTAVDSNKRPDLMTVPKPVLTSSEKAVRKPAVQPEIKEKVNLTIVVVSGR